MLGLGCTLSALVTAFLARGEGPLDAVRRAHAALQRAIARPRKLAEGLFTVGDLEQAIDEATPTTAGPRSQSPTSVAPAAALDGRISAS